MQQYDLISCIACGLMERSGCPLCGWEQAWQWQVSGHRCCPFSCRESGCYGSSICWLVYPQVYLLGGWGNFLNGGRSLCYTCQSGLYTCLERRSHVIPLHGCSTGVLGWDTVSEACWDWIH